MCPLSWFLDPGGWSKTAAVGLYFIFPGICTLSLKPWNVYEWAPGVSEATLIKSHQHDYVKELNKDSNNKHAEVEWMGARRKPVSPHTYTKNYSFLPLSKYDCGCYLPLYFHKYGCGYNLPLYFHKYDCGCYLPLYFHKYDCGCYLPLYFHKYGCGYYLPLYFHKYGCGYYLPLYSHSSSIFEDSIEVRSVGSYND
ncbi:hypothetical protein STEG23_015789 [Scotinomys teguina]